MKVQYHPAIERELSEIIEYYDKCTEGLGMEFLSEFERHILKVASMPSRWITVENDVQRSLMKRFP